MSKRSKHALQGKVAVVTGGSRGIGAEAARVLARAGVAIAVNGRDETALAGVVRGIEHAGGRAIGFPGDVTNTATLTSIGRAAVDALGPVDILLPFAGGDGRPTPTANLSTERWREVLESDLTSVFSTIAEFLPGMIERRTGVIVTMASAAGRQPSSANAAYAVAKAGVVMLTRHLAAELGHHGVRVNSVAPAAVLNDKMRRAMTPEQLRQLGASFPLGRLGTPTDVAEAVAYLVSAEWVTGTVLDLTGGRVIA